jgi:glycosyltransferase involved in cell wall biosynthesis
MYVGSISEAKGVGDILDALGILKTEGLSVSLKIAGRGDLDSFKAKAAQLQITDNVEFLGLVPQKQIVHLMRAADAVVVPSRHEYPEGFPMTLYEAMCSRSPIVASDHPMFRGKLQHQTNAMIFPAGKATALADRIKTLKLDATLYQSLSYASEAVWQQLQIPVKWNDLIERWLFDSSENYQWLHEHRLSSGWYGKNN